MRIWEWLSNEANQRALAFIGGSIAAVATAGWAVFKYINSKRSAEKKRRTQVREHEPLIKIATMEDIEEYDSSINQLREAIMPSPRQTCVGSYLPPPKPDHPTVILIGISGPKKGMQFGVDKEIFRIGSGKENDMVIVNDEYVSANHAYIQYEKGSLFIIDIGSRNGTFLNSQPVKDTGMVLRLGDHIRIGESEFECVDSDMSKKNQIS